MDTTAATWLCIHNHRVEQCTTTAIWLQPQPHGYNHNCIVTTTATWLQPQPQSHCYNNNHNHVITPTAIWLQSQTYSYNHNHMVTQPRPHGYTTTRLQPQLHGYNHNRMVTPTRLQPQPRGYNHNHSVMQSVMQWRMLCLWSRNSDKKASGSFNSCIFVENLEHGFAPYTVQVSYSKIQVWEDWEDELCCPILYSLNLNFQR